NERTRIEEALIKSETQFKNLSQEFNALLNAIPDGLTLLSSDLKVLWANQNSAALLGIKDEDMTGQYCYMLWHKSTGPCEICPVKQAFLTGNVESGTVRTADGRLWDLRAVPIRNENGEVIKAIEVARDVTQQRRLEEQLLHSQKLEAVGQLAGGVAHEFNNILTAIINNVYLAQKSIERNGTGNDHLVRILKLSNNAAVIARELLAFSRKQYVELAPLKLNDAVRDTESLLKNFISEDIEIRVHMTGKEPTVMADRHQLEQVIINLATNARDAMAGGGTLTIETDIIEMDEQFVATHGFGSPGMYAVLSVKDTGPGISGDIRQKIFEPFFTTKEVGKGTGLGLSIVYGIITQNNGHIDVFSGPKEGTTFRVFLPEIRASVKKEKLPAPVLLTGNGESILLAEDEASVRLSIKSVLEQFGYRVVEAVNGNDALEKFRDNEEAIDLLIIDVIMPHMNGIETYEEIKKISPHIKAVFISGYTSDIVRNSKLHENALPFISKPVYPETLLLKIRELLNK
ncbi:MAG: ATP-binding protein, partial [Nitrospirota bacterium]